jgi:PAS domain S-box-containing protein
VENLDDVIYSLDENGLITYLSPAAETFIDGPAQALAGKPFVTLFPKEQQASLKELFGQGMAGDTTYFEIPFRTKTGEVLNLHVSSRPIRHNGKVVGLQGVVTDMTEMKLNREKLRELSRRLLQVQEEERRSLARELHDEIGQRLSFIKMLLSQLSRAKGDPVKLVEEATRETSILVEEIRGMSLRLRPPMLDDLGLKETLTWFFEQFTKQTGIEVGFRHTGLTKNFDRDVNIAAYRIIQEAMTNVSRYAKVDSVNVNIRVHEGMLIIDIKDKGVGFDPAQVEHTSTGITGMRERAVLLGGDFNIQSSPGAGVTITARIPAKETETV